MNLTTTILLLFITGLFIYAIYDEIIIEKLKGKTQLKILLLRRGRIDGFIFAGLILISLWKNISGRGELFISWLLGVMLVLALYLSVLRQPKVLFKKHGFFLQGLWINYQDIQTMNLSQDGVLVISLKKRNLFIRVRNTDDLEKIYQFLITVV